MTSITELTGNYRPLGTADPHLTHCMPDGSEKQMVGKTRVVTS